MPGLRLQPPCGVELRRGDVDADGPRAALREPGGEVASAAPEVDDVETRDVAEQPDLGLRDAEHRPT